MAGNFITNAISDFGRSINAPVLFNWDTNAARDDAFLGNGKRTSGTAFNAVQQQQAAAQGALDEKLGYNPSQISQNNGASASAIYDPYSSYGGASNYNNLLTGFNNQKNNIYGTALDAANALTGGYNSSIQDTIRNLTTSQAKVDQQRIENEAAKTQGTRDILDMIGRGVRSGGVTLANRNAGNSSAAQAIANAYGQLGQRELSKVGNQYEKAAADIGLTQDDLNYQIANAPEKFRVGLEQSVNQIVADARNQLSQLDASMANASLPGRIAIDQERQNIKNQVMGVLDKYNTQLAQGISGISAASGDDVRARANAQLAAGQAPAASFDYSTEAPAALQGTGPFASELPIFTYNRKTNDY